MRRYLFSRLRQAVPVVFGVVTIVFLLIHLIPGDPVEIMLGENAVAAQKEELRKELKLDRPLVTPTSALGCRFQAVRCRAPERCG